MLKLENRVRLQTLLRHRLKVTAYLQQAELIYCEGDVVENLTSGRKKNDFAFQEVEADTMILSA